jgi:hypothetical protein
VNGNINYGKVSNSHRALSTGILFISSEIPLHADCVLFKRTAQIPGCKEGVWGMKEVTL